MKHLFITLLIISLLFTFGCKQTGGDKDVNFWKAEHIYLYNGTPALRMTVNNNTKKAVHNVYCIATAKDAKGNVLDTAVASFNHAGRVEQWETVIADGIFLNLKSHNDWASLDFEVGYEKK